VQANPPVLYEPEALVDIKMAALFFRETGLHRDELDSLSRQQQDLVLAALNARPQPKFCLALAILSLAALHRHHRSVDPTKARNACVKKVHEALIWVVDEYPGDPRAASKCAVLLPIEMRRAVKHYIMPATQPQPAAPATSHATVELIPLLNRRGNMSGAHNRNTMTHEMLQKVEDCIVRTPFVRCVSHPVKPRILPRVCIPSCALAAPRICRQQQAYLTVFPSNRC
jgi:hypothetical protein